MVTFRIKPKIRHNRHAITRKRPEPMNPWNPIGRKVTREAAVAATEITRRGEVRSQHRHGNDSGQKSSIESVPSSDPHRDRSASLRKSRLGRRRPAKPVRERAPRPAGQTFVHVRIVVEHAFVDLRIVCGGEVNFPAGEPGQHIAGGSIGERTLSARRRYLGTAVTLPELAIETTRLLGHDSRSLKPERV
jgi:hypothetical protein